MTREDGENDDTDALMDEDEAVETLQPLLVESPTTSEVIYPGELERPETPVASDDATSAMEAEVVDLGADRPKTPAASEAPNLLMEAETPEAYHSLDTEPEDGSNRVTRMLGLSSDEDEGTWMYHKGGNAIDAAVATLLCHTVALPVSNGIGGGFVATIYWAKEQKVYTLIARETAPAAATQDMFVNKPGASLRGGLSVGVPGELRGYEALITNFSTKTLKEHFNYSIKLAREGIKVTNYLAKAIQLEYKHLKDTPALKDMYSKRGTDNPLTEGDTLINPDLAKTYKELMDKGVDYFYKGALADKIVDAVRKSHGVLTKQDLADYKVRWEKPVERKFRDGRTMYSVRPPASGPVLAYILGIVDEIREGPDDALNDDSLNYHRFIEALKFAYAKRALLGDETKEPSVAAVTEELLSKEAAENSKAKINDSKTHDDVSFYGMANANRRDSGTSHSCYWDKDNNVVAISSTVNYLFGSQVVPAGAGFVLNDQMDDFSTPGLINAYGISPSRVNFIAPKKIPQSSMVPTIILDKDRNPEMCVGGSGGSRITSGVGLVAMRTLWQGKNIKQAIDEPRVHHQLLPADLEVEEAFPQRYVSDLKKKGHKIKFKKTMLNVFSGIHKRDGRLYANTDFRKGSTVDGD
ncbi:scoloptoxin SSD14-like [Dermacentor andersoni]|uniref:scoloptoxin SSD14-like n=1 Tax=Dermacentor andersoni TaxID=34620 RepID=UPI0024166C17|nr:scoloptoxin SSD14-like [Dermacentor andersoni]